MYRRQNQKNVALRTQRKKGPGLRRCGDVVKGSPSAAAAPGLPDRHPSPPEAHTDAELLRGHEHEVPVSDTGIAKEAAVRYQFRTHLQRKARLRLPRYHHTRLALFESAPTHAPKTLSELSLTTMIAPLGGFGSDARGIRGSHSVYSILREMPCWSRE